MAAVSRKSLGINIHHIIITYPLIVSGLTYPWYTISYPHGIYPCSFGDYMVPTLHPAHLVHRQHRSGARWLFDIHPSGVHVVVEGEALVGG